MWRHYRVITSGTQSGQSVYLVVDFRDADGSKRSRIVKAYGQESEANLKMASAWATAFNEYAKDYHAPIATGTIDRVLWEGFYQGLNGLPVSLLVAPLLVLKDIASHVSYDVASRSSDLQALVNVTQQHMSDGHKARFIRWLRSNWPSKNEYLDALSFQWWYEIRDADGNIIFQAGEEPGYRPIT